MVIGLGNPGKRYKGTPHNVGYDTVDRLAGTLAAGLRKSLRFRSRIGRGRLEGEAVLLVKPETYMNRSGVAVQAVMHYYRVELDDVVVVLDDADLELGRIRVKGRGSSGGHRGLQSVIDQVKSTAFTRVRIGVGRRGEHADLVGHVLSPFSGEDAETAGQAVTRAAQAVCCVLEKGVNEAMNRFNGPVPEARD